MKYSGLFAGLLLGFGLPAVVMAANGDILSRQPVVRSLAYTEWIDRAFGSPPDDPRDPPIDMSLVRAYYTPALYDDLFARSSVVADRIVYESDGLKIAGFVVSPVGRSGSLPVIIWCRGGEEDVGAIRLGDLLIMSNWARRGFIVLATQYRGGPGSEGHDEFGGNDVHDVEALAKVAQNISGANLNRLYLYGYSRGGMMVYRAIAEGLKVKAVVVNSGVATLVEPARPDMLPLYRELMPDYDREVSDHFCRRSALCWPQKLNVPLLLLHSEGDWRVPISQARRLTAALDRIKADVTLHVYPNGGHVTLDGRQGKTDKEILNFFDAHR